MGEWLTALSLLWEAVTGTGVVWVVWVLRRIHRHLLHFMLLDNVHPVPLLFSNPTSNMSRIRSRSGTSASEKILYYHLHSILHHQVPFPYDYFTLTLY